MGRHDILWLYLGLLFVPAILCQDGANRPDSGGRTLAEADLRSQCPVFRRDDAQGSCAQSCGANNACPDGHQCCARGSCGNVCLPDMTQCTDVSKILLSVLGNTECLGYFSEAVQEREFTRNYCMNFGAGLKCVASAVVDEMHVDECLARMYLFIRLSPDTIFDSLSNMGVSYNEDVTSRSAECFGDGTTTPEQPDRSEERQDVGVKLMSNYVIKFDVTQVDSISNALLKTNYTVRLGFITKKKQGILFQFRNADQTESISLEMNNNGGLKFVANVAFERYEFNTIGTQDLTDGQPHEVFLKKHGRQFSIQVDSSKPFVWQLPNTMGDIVVSSVDALYIGNNDSLTSSRGFEGCIYKMQLNDIYPLRTIFQEPTPPFVILRPNDGILEQTCGMRDAVQEKKSWDTACPSMEDVQTSICPQQCSANQPCSGNDEECCPLGENQQCTLCLPDMRQCSDLSVIAAKLTSACGSYLRPILDSTTYDDFCRTYWSALECVSIGITGQEYHRMCLTRMGMLMRESPLDILKALGRASQSSLANLIEFASKVMYCKENPLYEPPNTPVPADVSECSNFEKFQRIIQEKPCADIVKSSQSDCNVLKQLVMCVSEAIYPNEGEDSIKRRKCAGEIATIIRNFGQRLKQRFPIFGDIDVDDCEEEQSVCGEDLEPLRGVKCSTSRCPANYECKNDHCCPVVKEGKCPKPRGSPICKGKCSKDTDCGEDEKCCDVGCGAKTCVHMVSHELSKCEIELMDAKRHLEQSGICGDGKSVLKVPRCINRRHAPIQGDLQNGLLYCVDENGVKIPGSDFTGNVDCTKVRPGVCPATPSVCATRDILPPQCEHDQKCNPGQKCCLTAVSNICVKKCINAVEAPEEITDDCPDRVCCPITFGQDQVCAKDRTAVRRINSCGSCKVEFFSATNGLVDCEQGVTTCERQRARASRGNNQRNKPSDEEKLVSYIDSQERRSQQSMRNMRNTDDDDDDDEYDDGMDGDQAVDNDEDEDDERVTDEYGEKRELEKELPDDDENTPVDDREDDDDDLTHRLARIKLCVMIETYGICQNNGSCALLNPESVWQICSCEYGFHGMFCEHRTDAILDTLCDRDLERARDFMRLREDMTRPREVQLIHEIMNTLRMPILSTVVTCDPSGLYNQIQEGYLLPMTADSVKVSFCVDAETGKRVLHTPVVTAEYSATLNCDIITPYLPDSLAIPRKCLRIGTCPDGPCLYYWNQVEGRCERGSEFQGQFSSLTDCYDTCSIQRVCEREDDTEECVHVSHYGPPPCQSEDSLYESDGYTYKESKCHLEREFCDVINDITGECKSFPNHCLLPADHGFGDKRIGAYYFDASTRRCQKFTYMGEGGNKNRFYSKYQCHMECSTRQYKYEDAVCPPPEAVMHLMSSKCVMDADCPGDDVCCFDGKMGVCTKPVRACSSGVRCSLMGACLDGKCVCKDCLGAPLSKVCGTDGKTYESECHIEQAACKTFQDITVASEGPCPTEQECGGTKCKDYEICDGGKCACGEFCTQQYEPICSRGVKTGVMKTFSNDCVMKRESCQGQEAFIKYSDGECENGRCTMVCTLEYQPLCVYDETGDTPAVRDYPNRCAMMNASLCENKELQVLYDGECEAVCGGIVCQVYQSCVDGQCQCNPMCTKEYRPVCAYPQGNMLELTTFSNQCLMRLKACRDSTIYLVKHEGPCVKPEPVYECPRTDPNIVGSAEFMCNDDTNAYCDQETETCCPYGAGRRCFPNTRLVRKSMTKPGECPILSRINTDRQQCYTAGCKDDSDCAGDAKCCQTSVCDHPICTAPNIDAASAQTVSGEPDMGDMLCSGLEMAGITCQNGGTCVAGSSSGVICQCATFYYGPFCQKSTLVCETQTEGGVCQGKTCPAYPEATCAPSDSGCRAVFTYNNEDVTTKCGATKCLVLKAIFERISEIETRATAGIAKLITMLKALGVTDSMIAEMQERLGDVTVDDFLEKLMTLLAKMNGLGYPVDGKVQCTASGHFVPVQCVYTKAREEQFCYCIDGITGDPVPNTKRAATADQLNCTALIERNNEIADVCMNEMPDKEGVCDETETQRYYYNPEIGDCEGFVDSGCNAAIRNNFYNYETCINFCGVKDTRDSPCATVRCGFNTRCVVVDGSAKCIDTEMFGEFEPSCEADGKFARKQCNNDVCGCVDPDTGDLIDNSVTTDMDLECTQDGRAVVTGDSNQERTCADGSRPKFCRTAGDPCNNCQESGTTAGSGTDRQDGGRCPNCESCPRDSEKKICNEACTETTCKYFPAAICEVNKCTCAEEFKAGDRVIDCNKVQSHCVREKFMKEIERRARQLRNRGNGNDDDDDDYVVIECASDGSYDKQCQGDKCQCLNATSGAPIGNAVAEDKINCNAVRRRTKAAKMKVKMMISSKSLSQLTESQKRRIIEKVKAHAEKITGLIAEVTLYEGSTMASVDFSCVENCDSTDLNSPVTAFVTEVNSGQVTIDTGDDSFTATLAQVSEITTEEELYGPSTEPVPEEDDNKTTIIIVVVVLVVVALCAIVVAIYFYKKANRKKLQDIPFDDIKGRDNPSYR